MNFIKESDRLVGDLGKILIKTNSLRFAPITLPSGKQSSYFIDLSVVPSYPSIFSRVVDAYVQLLHGVIGLENIDAIGGIAITGLTYATAVAYKIQKSLIYFRTSRKLGVTYRIEGALKPGSRVVILDDVITTGRSIKRFVEYIRGEGGLVNNIVVLIDRKEGGEKKINSINVTLNSLTSITKIVEFLYNMQMIDKEQINIILRQVKK